MKNNLHFLLNVVLLLLFTNFTYNAFSQGQGQPPIHFKMGGNISSNTTEQLGLKTNSDLSIITADTTRVEITKEGDVKIRKDIFLDKLIGLPNEKRLIEISPNGKLSPLSTDQLIARLFATDCWEGLPSHPDNPLYTLVTPAWAYKSGVIYTGNSCPASVGIGTDNPQSSLDVRGNIQISGSRFHVGSNGNIGIGTSIPGAKLEIRGAGNQSIDIFTSTLGSRLTLMAVTSGGVRESQIQYAGGGRFGIGEIGYGFRMMIDVNGNVGIGCNSPQSKLQVNGQIRATDVIVTATGCDFVFDNNYKLPSLQERKTFILEKKHLPYIKPASDMQENGMGITETAEGLLQNIEEISLYQIQHEEKIQLLLKEQEELKKINQKLIEELNFLKIHVEKNQK
ncbi:MAG: hypothetical protein H0V01_15025 [Bacteroidetes bacterium]|nr:hypothetical protein [Bacteroidota bacterium]HET6243773.1 hypothetical protein [Bacteroidia bacterium]